MSLSRSASDPFSILEQDHQEMDELFDQYSQAEDDLEEGDDLLSVRFALVEEICEQLTLHARIEEEILYPELRAAIEQPELIDESEVEHATARDLIAQLESMEPEDPELDLTVETLAHCVRAHMAREETELFPMAREAGLDVERLAAAIEALRLELAQGTADD
jgi:iron-sulfur cluster repair protein YtfE (RIC family)